MSAASVFPQCSMPVRRNQTQPRRSAPDPAPDRQRLAPLPFFWRLRVNLSLDHAHKRCCPPAPGRMDFHREILPPTEMPERFPPASIAQDSATEFHTGSRPATTPETSEHPRASK